MPSSLAWAHPVTAEWFLTKFGSPTEPQEEGWPSIIRGDATLISAPTGSGKTLAAFLVCIDRLLRGAIAGRLAPTTQVVYVSPLKALSNDVQKNLEQPLREIAEIGLRCSLQRIGNCLDQGIGVDGKQKPACESCSQPLNRGHLNAATGS